MPASRSVIWPLLRPSWTPRVIVARGAIVVDDVAPDTVVSGQEVISGIDLYASSAGAMNHAVCFNLPFILAGPECSLHKPNPSSRSDSAQVPQDRLGVVW